MITFLSTHGAIAAQKLLEDRWPVRVMPVLREISLGCGIALRLSPEHIPAVRCALSASSLRPEEYAFYGVTGSGHTLRTEKLD